MLGKSALGDSRREPRGGAESREEPTRANGELQEERDLSIAGPCVGLWWRGSSFFGAGRFAPCSRYALLLLLTCLSYEGWSGGGLETAPTYSIPCECVQIYVGCARPSVKVGLKEHQCYICLAQAVKSAVAECSVNRVHCIKLQDTKVLLCAFFWIIPQRLEFIC